MIFKCQALSLKYDLDSKNWEILLLSERLEASEKRVRVLEEEMRDKSVPLSLKGVSFVLPPLTPQMSIDILRSELYVSNTLLERRHQEMKGLSSQVEMQSMRLREECSLSRRQAFLQRKEAEKAHSLLKEHMQLEKSSSLFMQLRAMMVSEIECTIHNFL